MIGKTVSHYRILEKLGEGGMGVVYSAEDTKLHRTVALKFLNPKALGGEEDKARFAQEARAAAALNHPNICTVHEINEHNGQSFIAMELVDGQSLKDRIGAGPLAVDEALSIVIQTGEGLQEAHEKGIVHRDVKPGNVMLTAKGRVKILDFGLARLSEHTKITKTDTTMGTAAYMSPEQASGKDVDRRSDIWSLGVVLYEMLAGRRPFTGDYEPAIVYSILHDDPEPLTSRRSDVPLELERIVGKALTKNPSERYQNVEDMLVDLRALLSSTQTVSVTQQPKSSRNRRAAIVAAVAAAIVVALAVVVALRLFAPSAPTGEQSEADDRKMLVVIPFENLGAPDDEYFADGITDAITARLTSVKGLGIISRQSSKTYKGSDKPIRQIGDELGVDYVLEGTVQRERPSDPTSWVRVIPQLIRVSDDTHVWAATYDEDITEVFRVQSDIAERVATQLDVALLSSEREAIKEIPTDNLDAYEYYLRALKYIDTGNPDDVEAALGLFQSAVSLDPDFVEAWANLARAHHMLYWMIDRPEHFTLEREAADRAYRLAPDHPVTHLALGLVNYGNRDFEAALEHYRTSQRLRPSGDAMQAIAYTLRRMGRWQEALDYFKDSRPFFPNDYHTNFDGLGYTCYCLRRFDEARRHFNKAIAIMPEEPQQYILMAAAAIAGSEDVAAANEAIAEMSRRADLAQLGLLTQGIHPAEIRIFPKAHLEGFDAFESGLVERYREQQPAMVATVHLARAIATSQTKGRQYATADFDSARIQFERIIQSKPRSAYISMYHGLLGMAYAGLDRCEEAIREGEGGVRLMPISRDAIVGCEVLGYLADIYVMCGEHEAAIDQMETLLSVPSDLSSGILRADPLWKPLLDHPRLRRLLED